MTCLCLKSNFSKTARNFWTILRLLLEKNISLHINLVSQLDALVGEAGSPTNIDKSKQPHMRYMAISFHDMPMFEVKFLKNGSIFFTILRLLLDENIAFHIDQVSQLDSLVGEVGILRNIGKRIQPYMAIYGHQLTSHAYGCSRISQKRLEFFLQYFVSY